MYAVYIYVCVYVYVCVYIYAYVNAGIAFVALVRGVDVSHSTIRYTQELS